MEIFRVTAYYKASNGLSIVNLAAACPTGAFWLVNVTVNVEVNSVISLKQVVSSSSTRQSFGTYLAV